MGEAIHHYYKYSTTTVDKGGELLVPRRHDTDIRRLALVGSEICLNQYSVLSSCGHGGVNLEVR